MQAKFEAILQIIVETYNNGSPTPEFNNAGQVFNHDFYWESISPSPSVSSCLCVPLTTKIQGPLRSSSERLPYFTWLSAPCSLWSHAPVNGSIWL